MNRTLQRAARAAVAALALLATGAIAQERSAVEEIERYRQALADGNPAELWEARGDAIWKEKRGPKNVSLEKCDLGLGPGVVRGAYTVLPKYFADTDKVEDLESRLVSCMVMLQGFTPEQAKKDPYGGPGKKVAMDALVAFITSESRGLPMKVAGTHPKEEEAYAIGEQIFFHRSGPYDFACATCHGTAGKRIRLQELGNLTTRAGAGTAMGNWPSYRVSQGAVWTMQRRLIDCMRQARWPEPSYLADSIVALEVFLQKTASGTVMQTPGIKR